MSKNIQQKEAGFTIAEILVVVIILSVLAAVALPRFTGTFERVRASEGVSLLTALLTAQRAYQAENGVYAGNPASLDIAINVSANFSTPPQVQNPGNPVTNWVARISRLGDYWLEINELGQVRCTDSGGPYTCADAGVDTATF